MAKKRENSITEVWNDIFGKYVDKHNFNEAPFFIHGDTIKAVAKDRGTTSKRELRTLCYQTTREARPQVFQDLGLFILPTANGEYVIVKGEGYVDIPKVETPPDKHNSAIPFKLDTVNVGNSEMQHLDYAYASSMTRSFMQDDSLVLTIRGRKYTPEFSFQVGEFNIETKGVQTELDSGYEGRNQVVLVEAKNAKTTNTIIRQLYYPYRQWGHYTDKKISVVFFERQDENLYSFWEFVFDDPNDYNSIRLARSANYTVA